MKFESFHSILVDIICWKLHKDIAYVSGIMKNVCVKMSGACDILDHIFILITRYIMLVRLYMKLGTF